MTEFINKIGKAAAVIFSVDVLVALALKNSEHPEIGMLFSTAAMCCVLYHKGKQKVCYHNDNIHTFYYRKPDGHYYPTDGMPGPRQLPEKEEAKQANLTMIPEHIVNGGANVFDEAWTRVAI